VKLPALPLGHTVKGELFDAGYEILSGRPFFHGTSPLYAKRKAPPPPGGGTFLTLGGLECSGIGTTPENGERMTFGVLQRLLQTGLAMRLASFRGGLHFEGRYSLR